MQVTTQIEQQGDEIHLTLRIPAAQFLKLVAGLKKPTLKIKATQAPDLKARRDELYQKVREWQRANPDKHPAPMLAAFMTYWAEATKSGKKIRYDLEKVFEIGPRLANWRRNTKPDELNKMWEQHHREKAQEPTSLFPHEKPTNTCSTASS